MKPGFPLGRHQRTSSHLASCADCAAALHRERQYLERLREARIPPASHDLTARLLERTHELAAEPWDRPRAQRPVIRALALAAGGTVAASGLLAAGALVLAGDPPAASSANAALSHASAQMPADGRMLSAAELATLRSHGWACPDLAAMGFHVESARAVMVGGYPAVELHLSDGSHYAAITEQRDAVSGALTAAKLRVLDSSPWTATYRADGRTFTFESDLPADRADDALPIFELLAERASGDAGAPPEESAGGPGEDSLGSRLQRGLAKVSALLGSGSQAAGSLPGAESLPGARRG
ncbi:anti-sigma factor [Pseudarthrobacter sp. NPDC092419]|uniref:anti-sigma factor n=1 Tax=Pseudarthrobacter sp. NPDC092419 TaxID=3364414 RepID=UPI0037FE4734